MPLLTLLGQVQASKTVGGTSQLSGFGSTGGLNVFTVHTVGGTDQLAAFTSTGDLNVIATHTIGGTDQLGAFGSSGTIQVGAVESGATGGFFFDYDRYQYKRKVERKRLDELEEEAKKIKDDLDKALALEFRKKEREESRIKELRVLTRLASEHKEEVARIFNENVIKAAERAIIQGNYSAMESLERQINEVREEEEFLLEAARIFFNA